MRFIDRNRIRIEEERFFTMYFIYDTVPEHACTRVMVHVPMHFSRSDLPIYCIYFIIEKYEIEANRFGRAENF